MEKISGETPDLTQENIQKIAALFPDVMTESYDAGGGLVRSIDFDALKGDLADHVVEGTRERYQFTWPGKAESKLEARRPTTKTMRPCPEKSVDWDTTQNLYIEGDNLEALKIMRETYAGKVKLIYIDPPYNTGHDFVYDDNFAQTKAEYDETSGDYDEAGGRLVANPESNGRFHSDWCSMMYPRLMLARDMLGEDGAIFISIDDGEQNNLRSLCNDVFGAQGFIAQFIWRKVDSPNDNKVPITPDHEYVLCYAKASSRVSLHQRYAPDILEAYGNTDEKGKKYRDRLLRKNGKNSLRSDRPTMFFPLVAPDGSSVFPIREDGRDGRWAAGLDGIKEADAQGRLIWKQKDGKWIPYTREFVPALPTKPWMTIWNDLPAMRQTKAELLELIERQNVFDTPKPTALIVRLIELLNARGDIILDFFSGSGTVADAVLRSNASENRDNRFLLVQFPEACAASSTAKEAGFNTICDLGEERIRRAGKKVLAEVDESNRQLKLGEEPKTAPDVGFRVMRIDDSCIKDDHVTPRATNQSSLDDLIDNSVEGTTDLDLLFQVLPKFRIPYSASIEKRDIAGTSVYDVNEGELLACFDKNVSTEAIEAIAKERPHNAIFRDVCFADDSAVANLTELFKTFDDPVIPRVI